MVIYPLGISVGSNHHRIHIGWGMAAKWTIFGFYFAALLTIVAASQRDWDLEYYNQMDGKQCCIYKIGTDVV
jgi:hypothetical protein